MLLARVRAGGGVHVWHVDVWESVASDGGWVRVWHVNACASVPGGSGRVCVWHVNVPAKVARGPLFCLLARLRAGKFGVPGGVYGWHVCARACVECEGIDECGVGSVESRCGGGTPMTGATVQVSARQ